MNKEYTGYLKGVAILLMIFLHLFKFENEDLLLGNLIVLKEIPIIYYISRMCNPVPFFLILSGYGLYATYTKKWGGKYWKRVCYLYIHLWIIYLIFVPLASYVRPETYPGGLMIFVKNATSWQCSYIGEQWFFLPYILLMVLSPFIFRVYDKLKPYLALTVSLFFYVLTVYLTKRYGEGRLSENMLFYNIFLTVHILFPFTLGYMAKKYKWMERVSEMAEGINAKQLHFVIILFAFCIVRMCVSNYSVQPFFAIIFIVLFANIRIGKCTSIVLTYLGKHSMNIWLIHTWICYRLFHDFVYGLHYPILIYLFVLVVSLMLSHVVELLYTPFKKIIK